MDRAEFDVADAAAMEAAGGRVAPHTQDVQRIYLHGELGAGKTTFVRGLLRGLGHRGTVKSPTFTLVEAYELEQRPVFHFDFYRVNEPAELDFIGLRDYLVKENLCIIEWAERAGSALPPADVDVMISPTTMGRHVTYLARSDRGRKLLDGLK